MCAKNVKNADKKCQKYCCPKVWAAGHSWQQRLRQPANWSQLSTHVWPTHPAPTWPEPPGQLRNWVLCVSTNNFMYLGIIITYLSSRYETSKFNSNIIWRTTLGSVKMYQICYVRFILTMFQIDRLAAPAILAKWESVWIRSSWNKSFVIYVSEKGTDKYLTCSKLSQQS